MSRVFKCTRCATVVQIGSARRRYKRGHVKTMWCWRCRRRTLHVLLGP